MQIPRLTKSIQTTMLQPREAQVSRGGACGVEYNCWPSGNFSGTPGGPEQGNSGGSNSSPLLKIKSLACQLWASSVSGREALASSFRPPREPHLLLCPTHLPARLLKEPHFLLKACCPRLGLRHAGQICPRVRQRPTPHY